MTQSPDAPAPPPDDGAAETAPMPRPRTSVLRRALQITWRFGLAVACTAIGAWAVLAVLLTALSPNASPRYFAAAFTALALLACAFLIRPNKLRPFAFAAAILVVLGFFFSRVPSNARHWAPDVERLVKIDVDGDRAIARNVRNFDYWSETNFTPTWETRTYDLSQLSGVDYILSYWGSRAIAHGIASFEFSDGDHLAVSIETRRESHESYSAVQGFFRQYELIYVFADERDILRLRTNYRNEDVYVYRTRVGPAAARKIFMSYVDRANRLHEQPEFYNALTTNCVTSIVPHAHAGQPHPNRGRFSWDILLAGYSAQHAYRNGNLDTSMPFEQLEARSRVNVAALAADRDPDFSRKIRVGLPRPAARPDGADVPSSS